MFYYTHCEYCAISDILLKMATVIPMCSATVSSDLLGLRKTNACDIAAAAIPSASAAYVYILYYYIVLINCYCYNILKNDRTKRHTIRPTTDGLRSAAPGACANHRILICYVLYRCVIYFIRSAADAICMILYNNIINIITVEISPPPPPPLLNKIS